MSSNTLQDSDKDFFRWSPGEDPVPVQDLMRSSRESQLEQQLMARMWVLCAIEMQDRLRKANCIKPHFERYRALLAAEYERFKRPDYPQVPDSLDLVAMSSEHRFVAINEIRRAADGTSFWPMIEGPWRVYENVVDVVEGRAKLVKLLMQDGLLVKFYDWANSLSQIQPLFNAIGRRNSKLRVLEIGAGTGGTSDQVLRALKTEHGDRLYSNYTFTDIASQFFETAKARFESFEGIEYKAFDVSKDPSDQGFALRSYNLVIASNVLHATPCLVDSLKHCHKLLRPDGFLFLQELSPPGKYVDFMVGLLPGWWLGGDDGRPDCPCIPPKEWENRLRESGFDGISAIAFDSASPYYYNANMLARPA